MMILYEKISSSGGMWTEVFLLGSLLTTASANMLVAPAPAPDKPIVCGGELNITLPGILSSHGYPGHYPNNAHCVWKLATDFGDRIELTFLTLDIEPYENCRHDFLEIYDGGSEESRLFMPPLCNTISPAPVTSSGNEATIVFHSDDSRTGTGFQIGYSKVETHPGCGGVLTQPNGSITPPTGHGGTNYLVNISCQWRIQVVPGKKVLLEIKNFNLEASPNCQLDFLEVYDGPSRVQGHLIGRWCGHHENLPRITSTGNTLYIIFKSDYAVAEGGFIINYTSSDI